MEQFDGIYTVIAAAFFGFVALAFILLFPVWRFIRKQERDADTNWTDDAIARRSRRGPQAGDGAGGRGEPPSLGR